MKQSNILKDIDRIAIQLKTQISKLNAKAAFDYISYFNIFRNQDLHDATGLHSPQKELFYFAGILTSSIQDGEINLSEALLKKIFSEINELANIYGLLFFPSDEELKQGISYEWRKKRDLTLPVFMDYFLTGELSSEDQVNDRIIDWFSPFESDIKTHFGLNVEEMIAINDFLKDYQENKIELQREFTKKMKEEHEKFRAGLQDGTTKNIDDYKSDIPENTAEVLKNFGRNLNDLFQIEISIVEEKFGKDQIDSFIKYFTTEKADRDYKYFTEKNHFEIAPLWKNNDALNLGFIGLLHQAIYRQLYDFLAESTISERFYKNRDRASEKKVEEIFNDFLSESDYKIFTNIFEDEKSQNEHDLIIIIENNLLIIETKASKRKEPFRDPDKAFTRIIRDFNCDRGIQKAYDQGLRLKTLIESKEETTLYNKDGQSVIQLKNKEIKNIYTIVITAERFGIISNNLSLLLSKDSDQPFPWSCYLYDLETLLSSIKYLKHDYKKFLEYLDFRQNNHHKFFTTDELEIAGLFLSQTDLTKIDITNSDYVFLSHEMSRLFDKIFYESKGQEYKLDVPTEYELITGQQYVKEMRDLVSSNTTKTKSSNKQKIKKKRKLEKKVRKMNKRKK